MAQGARVTRNLLHDNRVVEVSFEVNHGPILVDNNLFLSPELAQIKLSQGMAFVHNLIVWKVWKLNNVDLMGRRLWDITIVLVEMSLISTISLPGPK